LGDPNPQLSTNKEIRFGSKGSLCVPLTGKYAGCWNNFETDEKGSLIQLIQYTNGSTFRDSVDYAASF
jgi:putative DNA primase/helicase